MLDRDDRLEPARLEVLCERGHEGRIGGDSRRDGCDDGELHGSGGNPLLARMSRGIRRVWPVCSMHTRTGGSPPKGSGASVGSAVTVGLGMSPWLSDQIEAPVDCSVEQYAPVPFSVVPVLPTGEHAAPMTATGAATAVVVAELVVGGGDGGGSGGGGNGVNLGDVTVGDVVAVGAAAGRSSSARRVSKTATATAAISSTARMAGTMTPARSRDRLPSRRWWPPSCGFAVEDRRTVAPPSSDDAAPNW